MIRIAYIVFSTATAAALLLFPGLASSAVNDSLRFCAYTLIPSLFPFFVLSGILTACGTGDILSKIAGRFFEKLFGVNGVYFAAFFIGALCGFPGGAKTTYELFEKSRLDGCGSASADAEKALAFCSSCGPAYLILGVGSSLFGSTAVGVKLWLAQLVSAVAVGVIFHGRKKYSSPSPPLLRLSSEPRLDTLVSAIRSACTSIVMVCGTVVFFSVICRFSAIILAPLPTTVRCIIASFIEMTGGIRCAVESLPYREALAVCGFACGWSGMSVHAQTAAVTCGKLRLGRYLVGKLLCGIFTAGIMAFV